VKEVCPDAYSFGEQLLSALWHLDPGILTNTGTAAFDDQTSTFIIPSGAGFEVVFCPGARSTVILSTEAERMRQLSQTGHVERDLGGLSLISNMNMAGYWTQPVEDNLVDVLRRSGSRDNIRLDATVLVVTFLTIAYAVGCEAML
jgi:beta-mannosidase